MDIRYKSFYGFVIGMRIITIVIAYLYCSYLIQMTTGNAGMGMFFFIIYYTD